MAEHLETALIAVSPAFAIFKTIFPAYTDEQIGKVLGEVSEASQAVAAGTATEQQKTTFHIFSPFLAPIQPITLEKLLVGMVIIKYLKTPEGRKQLQETVIKYLDVMGKTMAALSIAGASHPMASLIHGRITISVYETLGLIQPMQARILHSNFEDNINKLVVAGYLSDVMGGIEAAAKVMAGA